jgi:two-component system sensor kinase FixL
MDAFIEAIIVITGEGIIERFNRAAEDMFGYARDEAIGQNVNILMPGIDHQNHDGYIGNYLRTREAKIIGIGREVQAKHRDGETFPADLAVGEVGWKGSIRFVGMMRDLRDQKEGEERTLRLHNDMINTSRLATMGEMAAAMAHEINQPLAAIANYSSAAARFLEGGASINSQAHRAGEIIRRLRSFVRPKDLNRESANLKETIEEILPLAELDARANNIRLLIDVPADLPEIVADQVQVQQVILNLIRNGIDAMDEAKPEERRLEVIARVLDDDMVAISVVDHGSGISEAATKQLFDPFYTTKSSGMGMGLAICQTIVTAHGGELSCANNELAGATFTLTLPTKVT